MAGERRDALNGLVCGLAIAFTLTAWHWQYTGELAWRVPVVSLLVVSSICAWGSLTVGLGPLSRCLQWEFPQVFVVGSVVVACLLLAVKIVAPVSAGSALVVLTATGFLLHSLARRRRGSYARFDSTHSSVLAVGLGLLAATLWSQGHLSPYAEIGGETVYRPWTDAFVEAEFIALFKPAARPTWLGPFDLAGTTLPFYHYGGFPLAAAYSTLTGTPAFATVGAFLTPFAMLLVALSAHALGSFLWGSKAGLASLALALLIPDASFYGLRNQWFGYFWLQQISASLCWGVAAATTALLLILAGCRERSAPVAGLGLAVGALCVLFKAQFLFVLLPGLVIWLLLFFEGLSLRVRVGIGAAAGAVALGGLLLSAQLTLAPTFTFDPSAAAGYLAFVAGKVRGTEVESSWSLLLTARPEPLGFAFRTALLLFGAFGFLPLLYALLVSIRVRTGRANRLDALPLLFVALHLGIALGLAPSTSGNPWELHHRPFVWSYFVLAVWCGGALARALPGGRTRIPMRPFAVCGLFALLAFPYALADRISGNRVHFAGARVDTPIPGDLLRCAEYIRAHSGATDIVQDSRLDEKIVTVALTERRAFLASPGVRWRAAPNQPVIRRRFQLLERLRTAATPEELAAARAALPLRYYLLHPETEVNWPAAFRSRPAFRSGDYRVYDLRLR